MLTAGAVLTLALPDDVWATIPWEPELRNDNVSPPVTGLAAFPVNVTVVPDVVATVPTSWRVAISKTVMPAATHGNADVKLSVLLEVEAAATPDGPSSVADSPTLFNTGSVNARASPAPTGLRAVCVKVAGVAVVADTVPMIVPVVWS